MQSIKFERTNGNIPKTLAGQDHISGFLAYVTNLPEGFLESKPIQACSSLETAEKLGISGVAGKDWEIRVLHYHLSEIYRLNPGISLYVGLFKKPTGGEYTFTEIETLQNFAGGSIRQVGVWCGQKELTAEDLKNLQGIGNKLQENDRPLSILYAPKVSDVETLSETAYAGAGKCNVSVIIGQAGSGVGADLYAEEANKEAKASVSGIGIALGITSRAAVHESIAWVEKFPTGVALPAFGDGTLLRDLDTAIIEALDTARFLFFVTYDGFSDSYFNDSHTMDEAMSDYAMIENVRTMDKAVRNIRKILLPKLGGTLYIDAETGKLAPYEVEYLADLANKPLEDMRKAGELSGVSVEIDPDQDVLSTSSLVFVIKQVGVGVLRRIQCKIGFVKSLN